MNDCEITKNRLLYPDIVKFVAIFLVTCSHSAQAIAGMDFTNFLGGRCIDIAFNMPLFMIISGWFINPTKMRNTGFKEFVWSKFKRLMIPAYAWYVIWCCCAFHAPPSFADSIQFYWYLTALFICFLVIFFFALFCKNDLVLSVLSSLIVICCPYTDFDKINFMFPFLWAGFFLRQLYDKISPIVFVVICLIIGVGLCFFWSPEKTVYRCHFNSLQLNSLMIQTYLYRFVIGFCLSAVVIYFIKVFEHKRALKWLAQYGQYSLVIYTASFVMNGMLKKVLSLVGWHTNQFFVLDLLSLAYCLFIVIVTIKLCRLCKNNKYASMVLMGE